MSQPFLGGNHGGSAGDGRRDRIAGAVIVAFAALLWFVAIPDQVDAVDYGWMRPQTLPGVCTVAMALLGAVLIVAPGRAAGPAEWQRVGRLALLVALLAATLWAMSHVGFAWIAPPLAAALALIVGERRWPWLVSAAVLAPALIWLVVDVLLQRSLP